MKIHVCLVSDQILANLIPALMERPDRVILVASAKMLQRKQDERLLQALAEHGLVAEMIDEAPDVSLPDIRRYAAALVAALQEGMPGAAITLNATGGTKLMMLGFVEVSRLHGLRMIYADTAHHRIEEIATGEKIAMTDVLDVPGYLAAQGMRFDHADSDNSARQRIIEQRATLTRYIGGHILDLQAGINILNGIIYNAIERNPATREDRLVRADFDLRNGAWGDFAKLLSRCDELGLVEWMRGAKAGRIVDLDAARYLSGGWLEEYAWLSTSDCRPFDVRMGVHRAGQDDDELNEFDLLAVHANQLLFVECKTANYQRQIGQANQTAYKVDSLSRQARGLFGETWLLSAIAPPQELLDRCRDARIRLIGPDKLPVIGELIQSWMRSN